VKEELEAKLFGNQPVQSKAMRERPQPDWKSIHAQLQQHRHLTLQLVWEEYRQAHPEGSLLMPRPHCFCGSRKSPESRLIENSNESESPFVRMGPRQKIGADPLPAIDTEPDAAERRGRGFESPVYDPRLFGQVEIDDLQGLIFPR
jgi:hypothetical protein